MGAYLELADQPSREVVPQDATREDAEYAAPEVSEETPSVVPVQQTNFLEDERAGLLDESEGSKDVSSSTIDAVGVRTVLQEMRVQGSLAGPIAANLLLIAVMNIITLSFVGHFGTEELAGAALATSVTFMFGRLPMIGMSCALDTLASQAYGAGRVESLAVIYQRTVAFLVTHCVGLTVLVLSLPSLLKALGEDPRLCGKVAAFSRALIPSIWLDTINRPMNRIFVAQKITTPQACVSAVVTILHLVINYLFVNVFHWGFESVAWANSAAALNTTLLMAAYVVIFRKGHCIWGKGLSLQAFKEWGPYARIAYPACMMECCESWCWGSMSLMAGLLPHPARTVAALSIAFSLFTSMFFVYLSQGLACSTRVGNAIGAGSARQARVAMLAARCWVPVTWLASSFIFSEPHIRRLLVWLYIDGSDRDLVQHIYKLLWLMIVLNLADGVQCVMSGVIQGLGRQSIGLRVNLVAFYLIAIPAAYLFGFVLHWGVEGLYCGLILGASVQAVAFLVVTSRVDWKGEAHIAETRIQELAKPIETAPEA